MLAGTDVFSNGTHVAVLSDKSFFTDKVWFNASTGEIRYLVEESELPENYVENMIKYVKTKFSLSADILNTAYYNFLYEQGEIEVSRTGWISEEEWERQFEASDEEEEETIPPTTMPLETTQATTAPEETTQTTTAPEETTVATTAPEETTQVTTVPPETTETTTPSAETTQETMAPAETDPPAETEPTEPPQV